MLGTLAPVEIPDPVFFHAARTGREKFPGPPGETSPVSAPVGEKKEKAAGEPGYPADPGPVVNLRG